MTEPEQHSINERAIVYGVDEHRQWKWVQRLKGEDLLEYVLKWEIE